MFIPIHDNVVKTFKLASKIWELTEYLSINKDGQEYRRFLRAKEIRNRLTHPRTYYDIQITSYEIGLFAHIFKWIRSEFVSLIKEKNENIIQTLPKEVADGLKAALKVINE